MQPDLLAQPGSAGATGSPGPVEPEESAAASAADPTAPLTFDGLVIDPARREIRRDGEPVELSALEFDLLAALAGSPGRVYSRTQLLRRVWGYEHVGDERVVDVHVRSIRRRLGDDASDPRIVGTVRGVGYKFLPRAVRSS